MSTVDRPKYVLLEYGAVIATVFAVAGVAALGGAVVVSQPSQNTVQETMFRDSISTTTEEAANVTNVTGGIPLQDVNEGDTLRNRDRYLFRLTPNLTLNVSTTLPENRAVTVTHRLLVRYQATVADGGTLGSNTTTLINETETTTRSFSTAETVDPASIRAREDRIRARLGDSVDVSTGLLLRVSYEVDGNVSYTGSMSASAPLVVDGVSYYVDGDLSTEETEQRVGTRTTTEGADPMTYLGLGLVGVLSLLGAAGSVRLRRDIDAEDIRTRIYRDRYEEWISRGEIPTGTDKRYVRVEDLEDIVDIGIDSNKRVIWNEEYDIYAVVDGDLIYYYSSGPADLGDWLNV